MQTFCKAVLAEAVAGIVCRNKRHCMLAFCESVPVWIGLSVRPCWQVLMWAFCEAVLAGAGKSNGLIVRLCWRELCRNKLHCMSAFCESVSVWVPEEAMDFL